MTPRNICYTFLKQDCISFPNQVYGVVIDSCIILLQGKFWYNGSCNVYVGVDSANVWFTGCESFFSQAHNQITMQLLIKLCLGN